LLHAPRFDLAGQKLQPLGSGRKVLPLLFRQFDRPQLQ
jgi:hypothetical protein